MINYRQAKTYCCEDISLIENYEAAMADQTQTWECHHRWETDKDLSPEELIFCSEYYYVPADRLIFLTKSEHNRLHHKGKQLSVEAKEKMRAAHLGTHHSEATREKISNSVSAALLGMKFWNNGVKNILAKECPGPEWKPGKLKAESELRKELKKEQMML